MSIVQECGAPIPEQAIEGLSKQLLISLYEIMFKIRFVEEVIGDLVAQSQVKTPCHLYIGQEAVATGVCLNLEKGDQVFSTHRSHGHYLAKGGDLKKFMAEIFCRIDGCSKGRGGSMHISDPEQGLPGSSAIVGGSIPLAVGAAMGFWMQDKKNVSVVFFGDGVTNEGVLYESLNFAALKKLPVLFVCENNFYSTHMHISKIQAIKSLYKIGELFNIPSYQIDGYNVVEVYSQANQAIKYLRKGNGPVFIEALTYRWRGHVGPNWDLDKPIRAKDEVYFWVKNCTIQRFEDLLFNKKILDEKSKGSIIKRVRKEVGQAIDFAKKSGHPHKSELKDVYMNKLKGRN